MRIITLVIMLWTAVNSAARSLWRGVHGAFSLSFNLMLTTRKRHGATAFGSLYIVVLPGTWGTGIEYGSGTTPYEAWLSAWKCLLPYRDSHED